LGKITKALQKVAEERLQHLDHAVKVKEEKKVILPPPVKPKAKTESTGSSSKIGIDSRLVTYFDSKSIVSEQYKILITNLLSLNRGRPPRVVSVTSSIAGEGKTITSLNLVIALANAVHNPRIVLIDGDMRKGQLVKYLGVPEKKGLSDYLTGKASLEEIMFSLDIQNLSFIGAGAAPLNPAELLASDRMRDLIRILRAQYDYVFIDTPPVIPVTDSVIIGSHVDGVIMVVKSGRTQRGVITRSTELLTQANANIVGHVLTGVEYYVPEYIYRYL
jgi:capsular exopolysaccharide synthesis family protein